MFLAGCTALLPSSKEETVSPWHRFDQVKSAYDSIASGKTKSELKDLGFDLEGSPNLQILSYLDVATMIQFIPATELDPGLQECLQARGECRAYVLELQRLQTRRVGNFWSDFFNFRRKTDRTGWRFKALLVLVNDRVTYKLWSGTPSIETYKDERYPLGPLQGSGDKAGEKLFNLVF
ncbi:MAG: hypothetical protein FDZ69_12730 [Deltaproteobacteria bacterium]|nr:MAG: hypothetical protein FDZ69_12730 [Deltaproteobacteria bacterium]